MTHYSIVPLEQVMGGMEHMEDTTMEIVMNGVTLQVQPLNPNQASIVRLLSCNPQDYLNPMYTPGRLIEFQPVFRGE